MPRVEAELRRGGTFPTGIGTAGRVGKVVRAIFSADGTELREGRSRAGRANEVRRAVPLSAPRKRHVTVDFAGEGPAAASTGQPSSTDEGPTRARDGERGTRGTTGVSRPSTAQTGSEQRMVGERLIAEYGITFRYRPLWDVQRKVLSTYICTPMKTSLQSEPLTGHAILDVDAESEITELDLLVLNRVWQDLVTLDKQGLRVLLACPVHYRTLIRGVTAQRYRSLCHRIPEELRQYVIFEVTGIMAGAPQSLIQDVASSLWSSGRSIIAQLDGRHSSFENCRGSRLHAVGADVNACEGSEGEIMSMLDQFVVGAREADLRVYVHGLPSLSLAMAAVCAGFDYIGGDAINEPVQFPRYIYRFKPKDLLKGFLP